MSTTRPILVTGASGMLGTALRRGVESASGRDLLGQGLRDAPVLWTDVEELDITDADAVARFVCDHHPAVMVNLAAMTDVDGCESHRRAAFAVNAEAVGHLASAATSAEALLVQISTDFVFDGRAQRPYREDDATGPLCVYGESKLAGELAAHQAPEHLVVRTAWLYGAGGRNFVRAIRDRALSGEPLRVVGDQVGCPTWTGHLAEALLRLIGCGARGTFHASGGETASWHEFACAIVQRVRPGTPVEEITAADLGRPARRPAWSVLDCTKLERTTGYRLPGFDTGLDAYLAELA